MPTALLLLDYQNDFVHDDGASGAGALGEQVRSRDVIGNAKRALANARAAGDLVIFVRVAFSQDYREAPQRSPVFTPARNYGILKLETFGTEIHPELSPLESEPLITKHRVSAFYGTSLELILRTHGIDTLVIGGVSTSAVVQSTVRDAHDRDFEIIILEDCCASGSADEHENSIAVLTKFASISSSAIFPFGSER